MLMNADITKIGSALLLMALICLAACSQSVSTPEDEIRRFIERGIEAAEDRDSGELMSLVHEEFSGPRGLSHKTLKSTLQLYFLRHKNIHLFKKIDEIILRGSNDASVTLFVAMAGSVIADAGMLGSLRARIYRFELTLRREQDWLVKNAAWQPATLAELQQTY